MKTIIPYLLLATLFSTLALSESSVIANCSGLDSHYTDSSYARTSSPKQVCEGVKAAIKNQNCSGLDSHYTDSSYARTSSPKQICEGVKAAIKNQNCSGLDSHYTDSSYARTSSPKQVCEGFNAAGFLKRLE